MTRVWTNKANRAAVFRAKRSQSTAAGLGRCTNKANRAVAFRAKRSQSMAPDPGSCTNEANRVAVFRAKRSQSPAAEPGALYEQSQSGGGLSRQTKPIDGGGAGELYEQSQSGGGLSRQTKPIAGGGAGTLYEQSQSGGGRDGPTQERKPISGTPMPIGRSAFPGAFRAKQTQSGERRHPAAGGRQGQRTDCVKQSQFPAVGIPPYSSMPSFQGSNPRPIVRNKANSARAVQIVSAAWKESYDESDLRKPA
jgi:hypothetical protein